MTLSYIEGQSLEDAFSCSLPWWYGAAGLTDFGWGGGSVRARHLGNVTDGGSNQPQKALLHVLGHTQAMPACQVFAPLLK